MNPSPSGMQDSVAGFMRRLTLAQKAVLAGTTVAVVAGMIALVTLVNRPTLGTLFSNLNEQDASKIVAKLKEQQIPYALEDGGKTVLVPSDQVYDLRLSLAGEGLPQSSVIGYEIFDRTNLGVSDFVQKVNYRRALEGELARTILQLQEVEGARVHLAVPERALFKEDEKPVTASVVLKLRSGKPLGRDAVQGITHLVSSSIEGLDPSNVTVVDERGTLLSDAERPESVSALTSTQYELQEKVEQHLAQKARSLLESVVGSGNCIVQVHAELDFRQVERTLEQYDPERTAVRSEEMNEETVAGADSGRGSQRTNSITNFEINKSVEHIVESVGSVRRLSVAALVNGVPTTVERDGQTVTEVAPRPQEEMDKLTELVRKAVGFSPERRDEVTVTNLTFGTDVQGPGGEFVYRDSPVGDWSPWIERVMIVLAMAGGVVLIRSLLNRLRLDSRFVTPVVVLDDHAASAYGGRAGGGSLGGIEQASPSGLLRTQRRDAINEYMRQNPEDGSRALKTWLKDE
jgi:flagellar M-ring protein FliF